MGCGQNSCSFWGHRRAILYGGPTTLTFLSYNSKLNRKAVLPFTTCHRGFRYHEQVAVSMAWEEAGCRLAEKLPFSSASSAYALDLWNSWRFSTVPFTSIYDRGGEASMRASKIELKRSVIWNRAWRSHLGHPACSPPLPPPPCQSSSFCLSQQTLASAIPQNLPVEMSSSSGVETGCPMPSTY